jgi:hypothetical protein
MKSKDTVILGLIAIVAAIFSLLIAGKIFKSNSHHGLTAPQIVKIDSILPDTKNDPAYNTFFNQNALNPTQLIQIGNNQNQSTFSSQ